jgi:hypothetical protein
LAGAFFASLGDKFRHLVLEQLFGPTSESGSVFGVFFATEQSYQDFARVLQA